MKRRLFAFVVVLLVGSLSVFAQGGDEQQGTVENTQNAYDVDAMQFHDVTITILTRYGDESAQARFFRKKVQEFSDMDNGITVINDTISTESDYLDNLRTRFATGDVPNVFMEYGGSRTVDYLESDALLDMTPYFDQYPDWKNGFLPSVWDKVRYDGYDGVYGVPYAMYMVALFCNTELFEKAGLPLPVTFDDLLSDCAAFKAQGIKPFQVGEKDVWRLGHFLNNLIYKSLGGQAAKALADRSLQYDDPKMIRLFTIIEDMARKGYFGDDILSTDGNMEQAVYESGGSAMMWNGTWYVPLLTDQPIFDKTVAIPFPYLDKRYANDQQGGVSDILFVSTLGHDEAQIAASVRLLKYLSNAEYFAECNEQAPILYPVDFVPTPDTPDNRLMDQIRAIANEATIMRDDVPTYDSQSHMLDTVRSTIQGIVMGNSAEEAAEEIVSKIAENAE